MQCPKCAYVRQPSDTAAEGECPSCGIIYSRFRPVGATPPTRPAATASRAVPREPADEVSDPTRTKIPSWVIPAAIGLVIGYFAGREHLKYEVRQTFQAAAEGVKKNLNAAFGGDSAPSESERKKAPPPKSKEPAPFSVSLVKKSYQAADYSARIEEAITFAVTFDNLTGKDIRAFDGALTFTDLLDNTIISAKLAINEPVSSGSQLNWSGQLDYNQFMDKHQRLKNEDFQNLKIRFETKKILFADGSTKEFEQ